VNVKNVIEEKEKMKILKNAGTFTVLSKTEDVISAIASAARTCYKSEDKASPENDLKLVQNLVTRGHTAMLEFADMTVRFEHVSRGFTHELVRHRLASYAQESTRYVDESDFEVVVPPHKDEDDKKAIKSMLIGECCEEDISLNEWFKKNEEAYRSLRKQGWKPEDARQVLPTAIKADIVVKANLQEWCHIFSKRCDKAAHWEIRKVMCDLLKWCQAEIPVVFNDFHVFNYNKQDEFARKIMTEKQLKDEISYYLSANNITFDDGLSNLIKGIKS